MKYEDSLVITRNSDSGSRNTTTGVFTPSGSATTVYNGLVDAQEANPESYKGLVQQSTTVLEIFLKDESNITGFKLQDKGVLTRKGETLNVGVIAIDKLSGFIAGVVQ